MFCIVGYVTVGFECIFVLFESHFESPSTFVLHTLCCNLGLLTFMLRSLRICRGVGVGALVLLDCVGCAPGNLRVCFLKQVGNECCLFANICE